MHPKSNAATWGAALLVFLSCSGASFAQDATLRLNSSGGNFSAMNGQFRLTAPPGAVSQTTTIRLRRVTLPRNSALTLPGSCFAVDTNPPVIRFRYPVRLTVSFTPTRSLGSLGLFRHQGRVWYPVPAKVMSGPGGLQTFVTSLSALVGGSLYAVRQTNAPVIVKHAPPPMIKVAAPSPKQSVAPPDR